MKKIFSGLLIPALFLNFNFAEAKTTLEDIAACPEKAGGVYYAYPTKSSLNTAPPKGYQPFYISHYGRHGSRYLISDKDYQRVLDRLNHAKEHNALTPLGENVLTRMDTVWHEARGRGGELSPLGNRQHHDIAQRMYKAFPQVFAGKPEITAKSTTVMRCAHSMFAFVEGLKELNPSLVIPRESGTRAMIYLNYHSPESGKYNGDKGEWYQDWRKFRNEMTQPDRLMTSLFSDSTYVRRWVDPVETMWDLYWVAVDMQNMETPISFFDLFTPEELYNLWQVFNFNFYACNSSYPPAMGTHVDNAKNLLNDIIVKADSAIANNSNGATLRFGHDGNIIPLTALLQLDSCYSNQSNPYLLAEDYADYKISPMASNLQIVFFKNPKKPKDILVKFMLNERETSIPLPTDNYPFYKWTDVRKYLEDIYRTPYAEIQKRQQNEAQ